MRTVARICAHEHAAHRRVDAEQELEQRVADRRDEGARPRRRRAARSVRLRVAQLAQAAGASSRRRRRTSEETPSVCSSATSTNSPMREAERPPPGTEPHSRPTDMTTSGDEVGA